MCWFLHAAYRGSACSPPPPQVPLTESRTHNLLVHRRKPNQLSHPAVAKVSFNSDFASLLPPTHPQISPVATVSA